MILPRISRLIVGTQGAKYVSRPMDGWVQILQGWHGFITNPITWGTLAEYSSKIDHLVFYSYPGVKWLNSKYKDLLEPIGQEQLAQLAGVLYKVVDARRSKKLAKLSQVEADVLSAAISLAGELKVAALEGTWLLKNFALPKDAKPKIGAPGRDDELSS